METIVNQDTAIIVSLVGFMLMAIAYVGAILPALPGVPLAALAIIILQIALPEGSKYSWFTIVFVLLVTVFISLLDYYMPIWGTKRFGGTPSGVKGSAIGLVLGALVAIFSAGIGASALLIGPFVGAYIGEKYIASASNEVALKSAFGSLAGFLIGIFGKLMVITVFVFIFVFGVIRFF